MDAHFLGHETATPVRGVCGLLLEGLADDLRFVVRSDLAGSTRAWSVLEQLFNATCLVPVEPLRDRRPRYAHLPADRRKRLRSPRRNRILRTGSPMRGIYRMYLLGKRFLLHYTRRGPP